ncbi:MAG TPA: hypothetical protein VM935_05190 [Chitinophagaceae bacterium]|jgi:hypothetical protein|nr:hypothetical protein [Chitinophagaceae bacterium]
MKLSGFVLLSLEEKKNVVLHKGVLVGKKWGTKHLVFLFQVNGFYVEVVCSVREKKIEEYRAFAETEFLTPYLESIQIQHLIE